MVFIISAAGSVSTRYLALSWAVLSRGMLLVWKQFSKCVNLSLEGIFSFSCERGKEEDNRRIIFAHEDGGF